MASELIDHEQSLTPDPPPPAKQNIVNGLRGGAAVLMVAAFEAFLDDLITEQVDTIRHHNPSVIFARLPDKMREWNVFRTLEAAMKGPEHQPGGPRLSRLPAIKVASQLVFQDEVNPGAFAGTSGNPSKKAVKGLFERVGINDILGVIRPHFETLWGGAVADSFIPDKLDEIVQRRHRVAHRAEALTISRAELLEGVRFLGVLGKVLDVELERHVRNVCRAAV